MLSAMPKLSQDDTQALLKVLTPSWLSGLVAVLVGLTLTAGVIVGFSMNNSVINQQLAAWQQDQPEPDRTEPGEYLETPQPTLQTTWPLMVVWAVIGFFVYSVAAAVIRSLTRAAELKASLKYVNAQPDIVLKTAVEHILLRLVAGIVLVVLATVFIQQVVPYAITAALASAGDLVSVTGVAYALLAFTVLVLGLHLQAIFLRLTFGRIRIFTQ